ncbi:reticulon-like protein B11 [Tasmannia lanceolata]|uniref:reticulon-like protein B11 n=1 Tax=Tasmannia lanceolata TaxID=3420 RepID=UPI0040647874
MGEDLDRASAPEKDSSSVAPPPPSHKSVHQALGGGQVADVLLWKRRSTAAFLLVASTTLWFLFERAGYSLSSLITNVLLLLVVILFFWAKSASLLNRPLPPLPNLEISDEFVWKAADAARTWINRVLAVAHDIAIKRDAKLFLEVTLGLWLVSYIGSLFNFLTLVYIGVFLSLTVPALYDKYRVHIDDKLCALHKTFLKWYKKIDDTVLSRISVPLSKEKKTQ